MLSASRQQNFIFLFNSSLSAAIIVLTNTWAKLRYSMQLTKLFAIVAIMAGASKALNGPAVVQRSDLEDRNTYERELQARGGGTCSHPIGAGRYLGMQVLVLRPSPRRRKSEVGRRPLARTICVLQACWFLARIHDNGH